MSGILRIEADKVTWRELPDGSITNAEAISLTTPTGPVTVEKIVLYDEANPCTAPVLIGGCDCSCQQCEIGYHCRNAARNCLH